MHFHILFVRGVIKFVKSQSKKHPKGCQKSFYIYYIYIYISTQDSAAEITDPQVGSQSEKDPIDQAIVVKCVFRDAPSDVARLACFSYFAWRAIASFQSGGFFVGSIESIRINTYQLPH